MNEWPTFVRTGTPPCSRITSGTAREQIRLCRIVAPGLVRSVAAASTAVVVEPDSPAPVSSTTNTRSASPSNARPRSKPPATTRARTSRWLAGCNGSAGWFGNVPSSSRVHHLELDRLQPLEHRRDDEPAHPVGGVGDHTQRPQRRLIDERHDVVDERGEQVLFTTPTGSPPGAGAWPSSTAAAVALISANPESAPTGRAPPRQSLIPLYCGRVVRSGEDRAGAVELAGREVEQVRGRQPEVDDVDALGEHPAGEGVDELGSRRPHVPGDEDLVGSGEAGEGDPDGVGDVGVELIGHRAADVVRLDDLIESCIAAGQANGGSGARESFRRQLAIDLVAVP